MKKTLVVIAHLDDEISIAGTIIKLANHDPKNIKIVSLCCGRNKENGIERVTAFNNAWGKYNIKYSIHNNYDMELEKVLLKDITKIIEDHIDFFDPHVVLTVCGNDLHQDHKIINHATKIACRVSRSNVKELYEFKIPTIEVYSNTYFDTVINISDVFELKKTISDCYISENKIPIKQNEYFKTLYRKLNL